MTTSKPKGQRCERSVLLHYQSTYKLKNRTYELQKCDVLATLA